MVPKISHQSTDGGLSPLAVEPWRRLPSVSSLPLPAHGPGEAPVSTHEDIALEIRRPSALREDFLPLPSPAVRDPEQLMQGVRRLDLRWLLAFLAVPLATGVALGVVAGLRKRAADKLALCLLSACQGLIRGIPPPGLPPLDQLRQIDTGAMRAACHNASAIDSLAKQGIGFGPCPSTEAQHSREFGAVAGVIVGTMLVCTGVVLQRLWVVHKSNAALLRQAREELQGPHP